MVPTSGPSTAARCPAASSHPAPRLTDPEPASGGQPRGARRRWYAALLSLVLAALAVRLIHVDSPLIGFQSWRQTDTAAIARNFYRNGFDLLSPEIDWLGARERGTVECEFPVYPYLVANLARLFGFHDWLGRALSALFAAATAWILALLVRARLGGRTAALWAAGFYAFLPLGLYYTRAFMPESLLLLCSVAAVYAFDRWIASDRWRWLLAAALATALAALVKLTALYLGVPLLYLAWKRFRVRTFAEWRLWLFAALVLAPVALWYWHAHQIQVRNGLSFGIWGYGTDKWGNWALVASWRYWNRVLVQHVGELQLAVLGLPLAVVGIFMPRACRGETLFLVWLAGLCAFLIVVAGGNFAHDYYQLPLLLPACAYLGKVFARGMAAPVWRRRRFASLALVACLCVMAGLSVRQHLRYLSREVPADAAQLRLAAALQRHTAAGDRVVVVDHWDPTLLYLSDRKGWHLMATPASVAAVEAIAAEGARALAAPQWEFDAHPEARELILARYPVLELTPEYFVVSLAAPPSPRSPTASAR